MRAYLNQILLVTHPPQLQTLPITLDHLLAGRLAPATDTLIQRFKACETALLENNGQTARHLEINPLATASLVRAEERGQTRAESAQAERVLAKGRKGKGKVGNWQRARPSPGQVRESTEEHGATEAKQPEERKSPAKSAESGIRRGA